MSKIPAEAVTWAYRLLLDRDPENDQIIEERSHLFENLQDLRRDLLGSKEYQQNNESPPAIRQSPFFHYTSTFDAIAMLHRHAVSDIRSVPSHLVNFLGVAIDPKFFPSILSDRAGRVEGIPIPANWHADIAEWAAALRAVELSGNTFVVVELGCGWGCWMNNTGVAARASGRKPHVIGIEGDRGHVQFAREALHTNGFTEDEITLHHGIAAAKSGISLFPNQAVPGESWGSEPIFGATRSQRAKALASGRFDEVPMIPLKEVIAERSRIDLLHIDIQGGEADLVESCISLINAKVAYLLIGTHSKQIEGRLYSLLLDAGWALEMERPAIFQITDGRPCISVDGVQGWRNPRHLPI